MSKKKVFTEEEMEQLKAMYLPSSNPQQSREDTMNEILVSEGFLPSNGESTNGNEAVEADEVMESIQKIGNEENSINENLKVKAEPVIGVSAIEPSSTVIRRISSKQRKISLEEYRNFYLRVPKIEDRKPVFVSCEVRDRLDEYVRKLGGRKMSVSGLIENIVREHLKIYDNDFEQWRKL